MAALASAAKRWPVQSAGMPDQEIKNTQQPVAIRQGGIGLGTVIAAVIMSRPLFTPSTSGRRPRKKHPPPKNLERGIEQIKDAAGKAIEPHINQQL